MNAAHRILELLERAPTAMTQLQITDTTGLHHATVQATLSDLKAEGLVDIVGDSPKAPGAPRPRKLWALVARAHVVELPTAPDTTQRPAKLGVEACDDTDRPGDDDQPQVVVEVVRGNAGFRCAKLGQFISYGDCIDRYTDATARLTKSPCRGCPDGERRRACYASGQGVRS